MAGIYDDIYVRDNWSDDGTIPSTGNCWGSPDIICMQANFLPQDYATPEKYSNPADDPNLPIVLPGVNNIYVRGRNLGTNTSQGWVSMYCCPASLFMHPDQWKNTQLAAPDGRLEIPLVDPKGSPVLGQNDIALTNAAFVLTNVSSNEHYCLVTILRTLQHVVPIPTFNQNYQYAQWVQDNPAVGWRNLQIVPAKENQVVQSFLFSNLEDNAQQFLFEFSGTNLPPGTIVNLQCNEAGCQFNVNLPLNPPDPTPSGAQRGVYEQTVPAHFASSVLLTVTNQNFAIDKSAISLSYYQFPESGNEIQTAAGHRLCRGVFHQGQPLILLGRCNFRVDLAPGIALE
jgi:hypothetical protein